jgi:hypothetical protein
MWPYWVLFLIPAMMAVIERPQVAPSCGPRSLRGSPVLWVLVALILALLVGLRVEIGGDWDAYLQHQERAASSDPLDLVTLKGPGYPTHQLVQCQSWIRYLGHEHDMWADLRLVVDQLCPHDPQAMVGNGCCRSYLITVVAMGYTRQGVAISLVMAGIVSLGQGRMILFFLLVSLASTFHTMAVIYLPLGALSLGNRLTPVHILSGALLVFTAFVFPYERIEFVYQNYVVDGYESSGAQVRAAMNALAGLVFLSLGRYLSLEPVERRLYFLLSVASVASSIVAPLVSFTAAIDRAALYLIPLQVAIFANLPDVWARNIHGSTFLVTTILLYYAGVHWVWLSFADHAYAWLPYRNLLFE